MYPLRSRMRYNSFLNEAVLELAEQGESLAVFLQAPKVSAAAMARQFGDRFTSCRRAANDNRDVVLVHDATANRPSAGLRWRDPRRRKVAVRRTNTRARNAVRHCSTCGSPCNRRRSNDALSRIDHWLAPRTQIIRSGPCRREQLRSNSGLASFSISFRSAR